MMPAVEKLLVLQERDRQIAALQAELATVEPQRVTARSRSVTAAESLEAARLKVKQLEAQRKELELEVESRQQLIAKYSLQQFQTKKNDEYQALTHEINNCKSEIVRLEDRQLDLMEQAETAQRLSAQAKQAAETGRNESDRQLADLAAREKNLKERLNELSRDRDALAAAVGDGLLPRYERLRKSKGDRVLVGVEHGACGGCHVGLPPQVMLECRADQAVVTCPNCGRILYYTRDMDLVRAD